MIELFYFLSILFLLALLVIAFFDYRNKLIPLWSFYILNFISIVWIFYVDYGYLKYLLVFYFALIITLDIFEGLGKRPKWLSEDWMIGNTGLYDYWFYIFLFSIFADFLLVDFKTYIYFSISLIIGGILGYLITKKKYKRQIPLFVYAFCIVSLIIFSIYLLKLY